MTCATSIPWFAFFPSDWLRDAALSSVSAADRGVWLDLLCLMWDCDERGVLITGGKQWTDKQISTAVRGAPADNLASLKRLLEMGVAKRRKKDGGICSDRMIRDAKISKARAKAGAKGGRTKTCATKQTTSKTQAKRKQENDVISHRSLVIKNNQTKPALPERKAPVDDPAGGAPDTGHDPGGGAATTSGEPVPDAPGPAPGLRAELESVGITGGKLAELASLPGLKAGDVKKVWRTCPDAEHPTGALVYRLGLLSDTRQAESDRQAEQRTREIQATIDKRAAGVASEGRILANERANAERNRTRARAIVYLETLPIERVDNAFRKVLATASSDGWRDRLEQAGAMSTQAAILVADTISTSWRDVSPALVSAGTIRELN